jgi:hypothetical protein
MENAFAKYTASRHHGRLNPKRASLKDSEDSLGLPLVAGQTVA